MTVRARASEGETTYRPFEVKRDGLPSLVGLVIGFFIGLVLASLAVFLLFDGFWPLLVLAVPFLLVQFLVQEGILGLWRLIFGRRPDDEATEDDDVRQAFEVDAAPEPPTFMRVHSIKIGIAAGAGVALVSFGLRLVTELT